MLNLYLMLIDDESDKSKFEKVYYKYRTLMHHVALKTLHDDRLAEEAVQEAFFRVARNFHKVSDIDDIRTRNFLAMITQRVAVTMAEKEAKHTAAGEEDVEKMDTAIDDTAFAHYSRNELMQAITQLPEIYKQVLYLQGVYEYTNAEIAGLLGISTETVKKRVQRGRKILKERLGDDYGQ